MIRKFGRQKLTISNFCHRIPPPRLELQYKNVLWVQLTEKRALPSLPSSSHWVQAILSIFHEKIKQHSFHVQYIIVSKMLSHSLAHWIVPATLGDKQNKDETLHFKDKETSLNKGSHSAIPGAEARREPRSSDSQSNRFFPLIIKYS